MGKVPEDSGTYYGIPTIAAGCYFTKVKADDGSPAECYRFDQLCGLMEVKAAGYGRTGMWTKVWSESVYVEADINVRWKLIRDLFGEFSPRGVVIELYIQILIKECFDAPGNAIHGGHFLLAKIANADLYQFAHGGDLHGIVHD